MKNIFLALFLFTLCPFLMAQGGNETVYTIVEQMPEYPGGQEELMKYLSGNLKYPVKSKESGIQGIVYVSFVVNDRGFIENVKILKGVSEDIDNESLRVVEDMPRWKPGSQKGKPVNVQYNLPLRFNLKNNNKK